MKNQPIKLPWIDKVPPPTTNPDGTKRLKPNKGFFRPTPSKPIPKGRVKLAVDGKEYLLTIAQTKILKYIELTGPSRGMVIARGIKNENCAYNLKYMVAIGLLKFSRTDFKYYLLYVDDPIIVALSERR